MKRALCLLLLLLPVLLSGCQIMDAVDARASEPAMKRALCLLLLLLPVLLSGCQIMDAVEGLRQINPKPGYRYPTPFSERWFELRKKANS